jgi:hypothetical protein
MAAWPWWQPVARVITMTRAQASRLERSARGSYERELLYGGEFVVGNFVGRPSSLAASKKKRNECRQCCAYTGRGEAGGVASSCLSMATQARACPRVEKRREEWWWTPEQAGRQGTGEHCSCLTRPPFSLNFVKQLDDHL